MAADLRIFGFWAALHAVKKKMDLSSRGTEEDQFDFLGGKDGTKIPLSPQLKSMKSLQRERKDRGTGFFGYFWPPKKWKQG